jgi:hypothetical protein
MIFKCFADVVKFERKKSNISFNKLDEDILFVGGDFCFESFLKGIDNFNEEVEEDDREFNLLALLLLEVFQDVVNF